MSVALFLALGLAAGAPPARPFAYEGVLEQGGAPADGAFDFHVRLYGDAGRVEELYDELLLDVPVTGGRFTLLIGEAGLPPEVEVAPDLYLALDVDATPLSGTQRLVAVPFSLSAGAGDVLRVYDSVHIADAQPELHLESETTAWTALVELDGDLGFGEAGQGGVFKLEHGAPSDTLRVTSSGRVGVGTAGPTAKLHVTGADGATTALVEETSATAGVRKLLELRNRGGADVDIVDTAASATWSMRGEGNRFTIFQRGAGGDAIRIEQNGNVTISGTLTQGSDARLKRDVRPLEDPLTRLQEIRGVSYERIAQPGHREIGVIAQDVERAYPEAVHTDAHGSRSVAYANLVAPLIEAVKAQQAQIAALEARIAALEAEEVK